MSTIFTLGAILGYYCRYCLNYNTNNLNKIVSPLTARDLFQNAYWMPETVDSTKFYTWFAFSYTYTCMVNFKVGIVRN